MHGDLSRVANGFRCGRCDGTIQEADLTEELMDEVPRDFAISDIQSSPAGDEGRVYASCAEAA